MPYEIRRAQALPRQLAAVTGMATMPELSHVILDRLTVVWNFLRQKQVTSTCHNVIVYLNSTTTSGNETLFDMLLGVEVHEVLPVSDTVKPAETSAGPVAVTTHWGPYDQLAEVHSAIRQWARDNSLPLAGPSWEVYGDWSDDPSKLRTDVFYLLTG
jgi:effector-binding domain-containing protein